MHIHLFGVVLFLHLSVAILGFAMAGVMHTALQATARAGTVQELRSWDKAMHHIEPLFPIVALLLLGLGLWLVHLGDDEFNFSDGWIVTSIVTLVAIEAVGGAVLAPRGKKLTALVEHASDGPVADDIRACTHDPAVWYAAHITTFAFLGVVFLMAAKPSAAWSWLFPAIGVVVGVVLAKAQLDALPTSADGSLPTQRSSADVPTRTAS